MLHDNESLVEPCTDYCVIGFLGRPRIHATKRDECQDDDGRVILQTTSDFGIVYLQRKGNERKLPNFLQRNKNVIQLFSRKITHFDKKKKENITLFQILNMKKVSRFFTIMKRHET